ASGSSSALGARGRRRELAASTTESENFDSVTVLEARVSPSLSSSAVLTRSGGDGARLSSAKVAHVTAPSLLDTWLLRCSGGRMSRNTKEVVSTVDSRTLAEGRRPPPVKTRTN